MSRDRYHPEIKGFNHPAVVEAYRLKDERTKITDDHNRKLRDGARVDFLAKRDPAAVVELLNTLFDQMVGGPAGSHQGPYTSRSFMVDRALVGRLMESAGLPESNVVFGSCETCVFGPRERGYAAPCVACPGMSRACHMDRVQLEALSQVGGEVRP